jgi:hypothetical protein
MRRNSCCMPKKNKIMKNLILILLSIFILVSCSRPPKTKINTVRDGFYEVMKLGTHTLTNDSLLQGQVVVEFDPLFNPGENTRIGIDTTDYVPLELSKMPSTEPQTDDKKLLSISLTQNAAEKMKSFTEKRVMKHLAVVIGGKAVTSHLIREAITGSDMQITRCDDNACEYLYTLMKGNVKR